MSRFLFTLAAIWFVFCVHASVSGEVAWFGATMATIGWTMAAFLWALGEAAARNGNLSKYHLG